MHPVLDRSRIAAAALDLVTMDGMGHLTMARLARELGVAPSALYNHVDGKGDLTALVQDEVMGRVEIESLRAVVTEDGDLEEALAAWARSYRAAFAASPSLIPLIATMPITGAPATRRMYDALAAALQHGGVPVERTVPVIIAFESFLFGSAMDVHAPASIFTSHPDEPEAPAFQHAVQAFTASAGRRPQDPADGASTDGDNPYADAPFEWGLRALLDSTVRQIP